MFKVLIHKVISGKVGKSRCLCAIILVSIHSDIFNYIVFLNLFILNPQNYKLDNKYGSKMRFFCVFINYV